MGAVSQRVAGHLEPVDAGEILLRSAQGREDNMDRGNNCRLRDAALFCVIANPVRSDARFLIILARFDLSRSASDHHER